MRASIASLPRGIEFRKAWNGRENRQLFAIMLSVVESGALCMHQSAALNLDRKTPPSMPRNPPLSRRGAGISVISFASFMLVDAGQSDGSRECCSPCSLTCSSSTLTTGAGERFAASDLKLESEMLFSMLVSERLARIVPGTCLAPRIIHGDRPWVCSPSTQGKELVGLCSTSTSTCQVELRH